MEDSECAIESKENLIAQAITILASRQENADDETHPEQVAKLVFFICQSENFWQIDCWMLYSLNNHVRMTFLFHIRTP